MVDEKQEGRVCTWWLVLHEDWQGLLVLNDLLLPVMTARHRTTPDTDAELGF